MILRITDIRKRKLPYLLVIDRQEVDPHVIISCEIPGSFSILKDHTIAAFVLLCVPVGNIIFGTHGSGGKYAVLVEYARL